MPTVDPDTRPSPTSDVKIREAVLGDYDQIAALCARNGLDTSARQVWEHLWLCNPVFKQFSHWPCGWVADHNGVIVGFLGNLPASYSFKGRELFGNCVYSTTLDPPYRGYAIMLIKRFLTWGHKIDCMVCNSANASSSKLIEGLRAGRVPTGDWGNSVFWITNYRGFLAIALERQGWPKFLAHPAAAALRLRDRLTKSSSWMSQTCELKMCSSFDERFDAFWESLKQAYPNRLLANRSREILQWHFKYALEQKRVWVLTFEDQSRILAYAIFFRHDNREIKL